MLIEFKTRNYLCFKDEVKLSMEASSIDKHEENTFTSKNFNGKLLKSAVIYGANASGKTNLLKAMDFMQEFVLRSSKDSQAKEKIFVTPFKLSEETDGKPSFFEIKFICDNITYIYGFELDSEKVHSEWLYYIPKTRKTLLFKRKNKKFDIKPKFKEGKGLEGKTRENALFLSVVAQFNGEISIKIINWFRSLLIFGSNDELGYKEFTTRMLKNEKYYHKIIDLLQVADLSINKIEVGEEIRANDAFQEFIDTFNLKHAFLPVYTYHYKFGKENYLPLQQEKFKLYEEESRGTQKLFYISGPIINALNNGRILIIDEMDSSLHMFIIEAILKLFNSEENEKNTQLIFNTHNLNLLSNKLFRRDQIYFLEKNPYGYSELYSLSDFDTEDEASYKEDYILGKYGAIPSIGDFSKIFGDVD